MEKKSHTTLKTLAAVIGLTAVLTVAQNTYSRLSVPYTREDLQNTSAFVTELREIEESEIEWANPELKEYLFRGKEPSMLEIRSITDLTITNELANSDLSDLKYFTNLKELRIYSNNVDLSQLKYNQNLENLSLVACNITNTKDLPNTIKYFFIFNSMVLDHLIYVPYNTEVLDIDLSGFTNIHLKNPKKMGLVKISTDMGAIDLSFLEGCENLFKLELSYASNISHPEVLTKLPEKCEIHLDDYAPVWLTEDIINNITLANEDAEAIKKETLELDRIANELVLDKSISDVDKIKAISNYIIKQLEYSDDILNETERAKTVSSYLNTYPIRAALDSTDDFNEVCVNYACLFQALANRVGLDTNRLISKNHTWNEYNNGYIDLTAFDGNIFVMADDEENRYHAEDLLDMNYDIGSDYYFVSAEHRDSDSYKEIYHSKTITNVDKNLGYIKPVEQKKYEKGFKIAQNGIISSMFVFAFLMVKYLIEEIKYRKLEEETEEEVEEFPHL